MSRARLISLPVIPLGILFCIYEISVMAAANGTAVEIPTTEAKTFLTTERQFPGSSEEKDASLAGSFKRSRGAFPVKPILRAAEVASKSPQTKSEAAAGGTPSNTRLREVSSLPSAAAENTKDQSKNSPSILEMIQGHDREVLIAGAIAAAFFLIGWISGGNYYVRRERRRRTKLRF